jgi:hypothetical protein
MNHIPNASDLVLPEFKKPREIRNNERHSRSFAEATAYWQAESGDYTLKCDQFCNGDSFAMEMRCKYGEHFVTNHWSPDAPGEGSPFSQTGRRFEDYLEFMRICILMNAEEDGPKPMPTACSKRPRKVNVKYKGLERGPEKS